MINKDVKILRTTDNKYPKRLLKTDDYPQELYILGNSNLLNKDSIAIVGSRDCSEYGKQYAFKFARELGEANICIISGMAIGIDTFAHIGASETLGNTIAVLGAGFNNIYPKENISLFNKILDNGGCIITEYEPDTQVKLSNFPKRNRIISGISLGSLVIEAKHRSGSSITAKNSFKQNKKVFCIPRNLGEKHGVGTNYLLKNGAELVTCTQDIFEQLNISKTNNKIISIEQVNKLLEKYKQSTKIEYNIPNEYKQIYKILKEPLNINDIAKKSNLSIQKTNEILTIMEIEGYIKKLKSNEYISI